MLQPYHTMAILTVIQRIRLLSIGVTVFQVIRPQHCINIENKSISAPPSLNESFTKPTAKFEYLITAISVTHIFFDGFFPPQPRYASENGSSS